MFAIIASTKTDFDQLSADCLAGRSPVVSIYRHRRDIFTNADQLVLEIKQPFEPNWSLWKT